MWRAGSETAPRRRVTVRSSWPPALHSGWPAVTQATVAISSGRLWRGQWPRRGVNRRHSDPDMERGATMTASRPSLSLGQVIRSGVQARTLEYWDPIQRAMRTAALARRRRGCRRESNNDRPDRPPTAATPADIATLRRRRFRARISGDGAARCTLVDDAGLASTIEAAIATARSRARLKWSMNRRISFGWSSSITERLIYFLLIIHVATRAEQASTSRTDSAGKSISSDDTDFQVDEERARVTHGSSAAIDRQV